MSTTPVTFKEPWEAAKAFYDGVSLYRIHRGNKENITSQAQAAHYYSELYLTPALDWKTPLNAFFNSAVYFGTSNSFSDVLEISTTTNAIAFDSEYLESCRVVLRALGELDG